MSGMAELAAGFAPTFRAPPSLALATSEAVRRRRLGGRGRVLLPQRELAFQIVDPFRLLGNFFAESFDLVLQPLDLWRRPALWIAGTLTRTGSCLLRPPCPPPTHSSHGTPNHGWLYRLNCYELSVDDARSAKLVDEVKLPATAAKAIRAYARLRKRADQEDRRAALAARRDVRLLRGGKLKMSARDAARLLDVSHQRVHQLAHHEG